MGKLSGRDIKTIDRSCCLMTQKKSELVGFFSEGSETHPPSFPFCAAAQVSFCNVSNLLKMLAGSDEACHAAG